MLSTIKNIFNGIGKKLSRVADNPYKNLNISWMDYRILKNKPKQTIYKQKFLNGYITFNNVPEFLHGVNEIFVNNIYDIKLHNDRPIILDCGGHIGLSGLYFKRAHPKADITIFEPDEKNFEFLKKNILAQGYNDVVLRKEAIWNENTILTFASEASMSSKIVNNDKDGINVKAVRLKDFITSEVDLLKLDIEGAEYKVLKDIRENLHLVKNIFIEYHGLFSQQDELLDILKWVNAAGFKFYIKEAYEVYPHPFNRNVNSKGSYDIQLNIFCFRQD